MEELKVSFVTYLQQCVPDALKCEVENLFKKNGHEILWTPPYSPDLQPIEVFWALGKNHAAYMYYDGRTMKETIRALREGWYGTFDTYAPNHFRFRHPVDCEKLWIKALRHATTDFLPLCRGLSGTVFDLIIDKNYTPEPVNLPIDTLVEDLGNCDAVGDTFVDGVGAVNEIV